MKSRLTTRQRTRIVEKSAERLKTLLVSWVYNSHGQSQEVIDGMRQTQNKKWRDLCFKTNVNNQILDPKAFDRISGNAEEVAKIASALGFDEPPKEEPKKKTFVQKIKELPFIKRFF